MWQILIWWDYEKIGGFSALIMLPLKFIIFLPFLFKCFNYHLFPSSLAYKYRLGQSFHTPKNEEHFFSSFLSLSLLFSLPIFVSYSYRKGLLYPRTMCLTHILGLASSCLIVLYHSATMTNILKDLMVDHMEEVEPYIHKLVSTLVNYARPFPDVSKIEISVGQNFRRW